jgi:two-component system response regulator CpxR
MVPQQGGLDRISGMAQQSNSRTDRLLIVDDDVKLCDLVAEFLKPDGFELDSAHDGESGLLRAVSGEHALVILDVMLPGFNGFEVLRRIRLQSSVPVLMLTARGDGLDRVVGLEIGADDYLPKPFNPRELVARIRAILRRIRPSDSKRPESGQEQLAVGDVEMDIGARVVRLSGEVVELTGVEFQLLEILLRSAGSVVARNELSKIALGRALSPYDRSLDMHLSNLRKKLGHRVGNAERIKTLRGVGYVYTVPST